MPQGEELCHLLASAEGLGLVVLNKTFRDMIKAFDDCIKGFTGSAAYKDDPLLKCERFYQILKAYTRLLESALSDSMLAHDPALRIQARSLRSYLPRGLENIKTDFKNLLKSEEKLTLHEDLERFFQPTPIFNVAYAALGSLSLPDRCHINSFEDYFTTIHQSLLKASSSIETKSGLKVEDLPSSVQQICRMITNLQLRETLFNNPTLQFIDWHYPYLRIGYNGPLVLHSVQFEIEAELSATGEIKSLICQGNFFASKNMKGVDSRADQISLYIFSTYYTKGMKASPQALFSPKKDTAPFSWSLPLEVRERSSCLEEVSYHLQLIIDFLQYDTILPPITNYAHLIKDHIEVMPLIFKCHPSHSFLNAHEYFEALLAEYTPENITFFLKCFSWLSKSINPADPLLQKIIRLLSKLPNQALNCESLL